MGVVEESSNKTGSGGWAEKRAAMLQPGESFFTNVRETGHEVYGFQPVRTLDQYIQGLMASGRFDSVRVVPEGAFDDLGRPVKDSVAVVVRFKRE